MYCTLPEVTHFILYWVILAAFLFQKSLEVEYVLYELASVTCDMCLLPHTCYKGFSMCIINC